MTISHQLPYQRSFDATTTATPITEGHLNTFHYRESPIENTIVFNRPNGMEVDLAVQHTSFNHEVHLVVFNMECGEPVTIHEEVTLSYQEARMLRDLLNRKEIGAYLEQDFH